MPRKTKETNELTKTVKPSKATDVLKKETTKKATKPAKEVVTKAKTNTKKTSNVAKKTSATSKTIATKKGTTTKAKKSTASKSGAKKPSTKKATTKKKSTTKSTAKKATSKKKTNTSKKQKVEIVEYYDLPYRYNQTVIKVLAQTPNNLFIYWDISDKDRENYKLQYGENFFETTKPVLIIHNTTMNYSFEIDINDFANSWYLHVNDADCDYAVELGRRPIYSNSNIDNYIYVSTSNDMEMPNSHILFDKLGSSVFFKNIKNNSSEKKDILSLSFIKNLGQVYDIYEFYKEIYKDEINIEDLSQINLSSSSSSNFM